MPRVGKHKYGPYEKAHKDDTLRRMNARNRYEAKHGPIPAGMDLDHKKPLIQGGSDKPGNLRLRPSGPNRADKSMMKGRLSGKRNR